MWQKRSFSKDCFSKTTSEPSYKFSGNNSLGTKFQPKMFQSSQNFQNKPENSSQKDFEMKYRKAKAKLALLEAASSVPQSPQAPKPPQAKNKGWLLKHSTGMRYRYPQKMKKFMSVH